MLWTGALAGCSGWMLCGVTRRAQSRPAKGGQARRFAEEGFFGRGLWQDALRSFVLIQKNQKIKASDICLQILRLH